jgi:hypothetical protein
MMAAEILMSTSNLLRFVTPGFLALVLAACGARVNAGSGGNAGTGGSTATVAADACTVAADCGWGEIEQEINSSADCPCLLGCPFTPLSTTTIARRQAAYQSLCTPGQDGQGNPCPIDDCASPPALACTAGHCVAAQTP